MKKAVLLLSTLVITITVLSQLTPGIAWQRTLGGSGGDNNLFTVRTKDNGIISIGKGVSSNAPWPSGFLGVLFVQKFNADGVSQWVKSFNASITDLEDGDSYVYNNNDGSLVILCDVLMDQVKLNDMYVVKLDSNGNRVWEQYLGGMERDYGSHIIKSANGGYLVAGTCALTEFDVNTYVGRLSEAGAILWEKKLGGSQQDSYKKWDAFGKVAESTDGSVYLLTETMSSDGDVAGAGAHGDFDLWLVKFNSSGVPQWSKCFGGSSNEYTADLKIFPSGDLALLGFCSSTQLTINGAFQGDYYFARVSPAGDLLFQKCYGSTSNDLPTQIVSVDNDGSCVLVGQVTKGDGDVQNYHGLNSNDIWMIKINQAGNILWQRCIGGSDQEVMQDGPADFVQSFSDMTGGVIKTSDGGYFLSAYTTSGGDGDVTRMSQGRDLWVAKLSATGVVEWARNMGGSGDEFPKGLPVELGPNSYAVGAETSSSDGDINRINGGYDPWIIKMGSINTIKGTLFVDKNANGTKDANEPLFSDATVNVSKGAGNWTVVPYNGDFYLTVDTGTYVSTVTLNHPYYTIIPSSHSSSFATYFNKDSFSFALQPIPGQKDLRVDVSPITPARPGFLMDYEISYKNAGNVAVPSGQVLFKKDVRLQYISSVPAISSSNGDTLKWDFTNLDPAGMGLISLKLRLASPPTVNIGDSVISTAIITPVADDVTPADDTTLVKQFVQGAYDPNDKTETTGLISMAQIAAGDYLNYVIRFQNTGNDLAFNITVRDTLDANLDWSSFEMVGSSHPYQLEINDDNKLSWNFYNILLADSVHNEPASHGYIAYRIKPKATLVNGNLMKNKASIYFDFNLPIVTNETVSRVGVLALIGALPLGLVDFNAKYQKPDATLEWSTADESNVDKFVIERGTDPIHFVPVGTVIAKGNNNNSITRYQFKDPLAATSGEKFYYRLRITDLDRKFSYSNVQLIRREGGSINELTVSPNPIKGRFGFAWINLQKETIAEIGVVDMKGNYRSLGKQRINKGFNVVPLDFFGLSDGAYLLQVKTGNEKLISRFVLVQ